MYGAEIISRLVSIVRAWFSKFTYSWEFVFRVQHKSKLSLERKLRLPNLHQETWLPSIMEVVVVYRSGTSLYTLVMAKLLNPTIPENLHEDENFQPRK